MPLLEHARKNGPEPFDGRRLPLPAGKGSVLVLGEAIDCLRLVREHRHAAGRGEPPDELDDEIGANPDDVLCLVHDEVLELVEVVGHPTVGPDQLDEPLDVLLVGADPGRPVEP